MRCSVLVCLSGSLLLVVSSASGQVTVQQPIVERFGVNTTVSIPDRGWAHLGSISRAESFRSSHGFFQPGSSLGSTRMHSGVSAGVRIIDLREMDRMILGYDPSTRQRGRYPAASQPSAIPQEQRKQQLAAERRPGLASAWYRLGQKAESRGRIERARECYERASSNGSVDAKQRLVALSTTGQSQAIVSTAKLSPLLPTAQTTRPVPPAVIKQPAPILVLPEPAR